MKIKPDELHLLAYFSLLPASFYLVANLWLCLANERIYHSSDFIVGQVGPSDLVAEPTLTLRAMIEFLPPFAHDTTSARYIWPERAVYAVWFAAVAIVLLLPIIQIKLFLRFYRFARRANPPVDA